MKTVVRRMMTIAAALLVAATLCAKPKPAQAQTPAWLSSAVIYCVDPEIFSPSGLAGVTAQLPRLQSLGVNVIWIMPIYPRGKAITIGGASRPSFNSPYCINNMEGVDPAMGTSTDMTHLITAAHGRGMKVILDVAINATSWDNPLVTSNPQYYLHSDGNVNNVNSIEIGWGMDNDIAQFDLSQNTYGAQTYVRNVCKYWLSTYNLDGFRFDTADNPSGPSRSLPQSLAQSIKSDLQAINPNVLMLGEEYNQQIALAPYGLDYDIWVLQPAIKQACTSGNSAAGIQNQWQSQTTGWPAGMLHMSVMQDWDTSEDLNMYGGTAQTMDAAVENFTINGVPMLFCGEEVANSTSGLNTHNQINWSGSNATAFASFYTSLINLRDANPALQQGSMVWETNSASSAVTTLNRVSGSSNFYIEVNFSGSTQTGTLTAPGGVSWTDVSPTGSPGGTSHQLPSTGSFNLKPYDFAIFQSGGTPTASAPAFSPAGGNYTSVQTVTLSDSTTGASIYYTTNGTTPTTSSTKYTGAIRVSTSETIQAIAAATGYNNSTVASATYTIYTGPPGGLTGVATPVTAAQAFNLTTLGTNDWAAWGYNSNDRDSSGGSKISAVSVFGGGSLTTFTSSFLGFTWTNGTPDVTATNETNGYFNNGGVGDGFSIIVPATTTTQTLTLFVGGWTTGGTLTATLSDGSAVAYTDSSMSNSGNSYFGYYALTFHSGTANQTLNVVWKEASGTGNVTLYAAALSGAAMPTVATPTFSPAPGTYTGTQSVTLSDSTSGATIYYTTNGTTPTTSSTLYSGAIAVSSTETIQAIAALTGYNNSGIASGTYTINTGSGGSLTGSVTPVTSAQAFNLTNLGTGDWAAWGYNSNDRDASGGSKIGGVSVYGGGSLNTFTSSFMGFTWTNGTPDASVSNETNGYYNAGGIGDGFSITAPASTTSQTLTVFVGGWTTGGTLNATLSDGSAASYSNSGLSNSGNSYYGYYTLNFAAASAGQTLKVVWKQASGTGNVTFYAATLTGAPPVETPYTGTALALPGTMNVDNYDKGGEGLAYHDTDAANNGGQYRTTEGVDIETCSDGIGIGNGFDVGWTQPGEWEKYTVNAGTTKTYTLNVRVASGIGSGTAGTFHIENQAGTNISGEITVSATGGWQTWATLTGSAALTAGQQTLKLVTDSGNGAFNIEYVKFI